MISIIKATEEHSQLLSDLAKTTFIESHGHSAPPADIHSYIATKYTPAVFQEELSDSKNRYHLLYHAHRPVAYSKITFNTPYTQEQPQNTAKLERLYLLKECYDLKLGLKLLQFNLDLSKSHQQTGIWLFVWKENHRAVNFYKKIGFEIIGSHDFQISATHANPNHHMFLKL